MISFILFLVTMVIQSVDQLGVTTSSWPLDMKWMAFIPPVTSAFGGLVDSNSLLFNESLEPGLGLTAGKSNAISLGGMNMSRDWSQCDKSLVGIGIGDGEVMLGIVSYIYS